MGKCNRNNKNTWMLLNTGRRYINEVLLSEGEKFPNLHYHFEHKLTDIDVEKADISFQCPGNEDPIKVWIFKTRVFTMPKLLNPIYEII